MPVWLGELQGSGGGIRPLRRRRVNFLEHGQWQPGAAGREVPPHFWIRNELGQGLIAPPLRPRWQPALGISHLPQLRGQAGRNGFHPGLPRDRQAGVDEDVTADLFDDGTRRGQQRPCPAMAIRIAGCPAALLAITSAWREQYGGPGAPVPVASGTSP